MAQIMHRGIDTDKLMKQATLDRRPAPILTMDQVKEMVHQKEEPSRVTSCSICGKQFLMPPMFKNVRGNIKMPCRRCSKKMKQRKERKEQHKKDLVESVRGVMSYG